MADAVRTTYADMSGVPKLGQPNIYVSACRQSDGTVFSVDASATTGLTRETIVEDNTVPGLPTVEKIIHSWPDGSHSTQDDDPSSAQIVILMNEAFAAAKQGI
jgi:hypothetical protein